MTLDLPQQPNEPGRGTTARANGPTGDYYSHVRTDVLSLIPPDARAVLSVGCGAGATEAILVEEGHDVVGVELNPEAARHARERGIDVICGDACEVARELQGLQFDCLIYADVLEHVADPIPLLKEHLEHLVPGGIVVVSVPNFRHLEVLYYLFVRGHINYQPAGIRDRTHVRLTTRRLLHEWMRDVGLTVSRTQFKLSRRTERLADALSFGLFRELLARQILCVATKPR